MRDKFVEVTCNFLINHIATKEYKGLIWAIYLAGRESLGMGLSEKK